MDAGSEHRDMYRYMEVERHIEDMIDRGTLKPGERVPSLRKLGATFGVSVSTVSQAYLELERRGLIRSRERSGFFVCEREKPLPKPEPSGERCCWPRLVNKSGLIRNVYETLGRTDLVRLGVAYPDLSLLPVKTLARLGAKAMRDDPHAAADYQNVSGHEELRRQLALLMSRRGLGVRPEEIIVTAGAMEALYISMRSVVRTGDAVLIQSPSYFSFLRLLESLGLRAIEIPGHPDTGVDPADVAHAVDTTDIRACIFCLNYNNPDGGLTSDEAKAEIVDILARRGIPLVEDDVNADLAYDLNRPGTALHHDGRGRVMLCSSFSKTLAPGYRIGWLVPGKLLSKAGEIKATTNVCNPGMPQMAAAEYLRTHNYERHVGRLSMAVAKSAEQLRCLVGEHFPEGTKITRPRGGLALWVELPKGVDGRKLFIKARDRGIGIAPGPIFSSQDKYDNFIRLTATGMMNDSIAGAVARLGDMVREQMEAN